MDVEKLNVLIASRSKPVMDELVGIISALGFDVEHRFISNGHSDPLFGVEEQPDILVYCLSDLYEDELSSLLARPAAQRPPTVIIGPAGNTSCMRAAIQAGARDYLEQPIREDELSDALQRLKGELRQHQQASFEGGALVAVVSAKGGTGGSFLAANLAHLMVASSGLNVALVDLDLQFGSLCQYLDLHPENGLIRALELVDELDEVALDAYMGRHQSGVRLLAPKEDELVLSRDIPVERLARLLDVLTRSYDRVVVDLPRQIDDLSAAVYERAERVLIVTQQELANVRDAVRLRSLLLRELAVPKERITMVVNRYDKALPVELADICKAIGIERSECMMIPNHYRSVAESINVGVPMLEHARGSSVTRALMDLESQLGGAGRDDQRRGLFSRAISNLMRG